MTELSESSSEVYGGHEYVHAQNVHAQAKAVPLLWVGAASTAGTLVNTTTELAKNYVSSVLSSRLVFLRGGGPDPWSASRRQD